uniref:Uncharacterized protein n=1 Tax=Populus alba TaxID=43335 RepID=A0A4U5PYN8_POPAL|nr:hypothetical protein D5086_0000161010 [Populus alba]
MRKKPSSPDTPKPLIPVLRLTTTSQELRKRRKAFVNGAHGFRSRNHPKEMALIVEFLKGRVLLFPGSEAFLSRSGNFLSRIATAALGEPTLEVDPDEVIDPALATGKAFMGAFLTASGHSRDLDEQWNHESQSRAEISCQSGTHMLPNALSFMSGLLTGGVHGVVGMVRRTKGIWGTDRDSLVVEDLQSHLLKELLYGKAVDAYLIAGDFNLIAVEYDLIAGIGLNLLIGM